MTDHVVTVRFLNLLHAQDRFQHAEVFEECHRMAADNISFPGSRICALRRGQHGCITLNSHSARATWMSGTSLTARLPVSSCWRANGPGFLEDSHGARIISYCGLAQIRSMGRDPRALSRAPKYRLTEHAVTGIKLAATTVVSHITSAKASLPSEPFRRC